MQPNPKPPRLAEWLFSIFFHDEGGHAALGDLEEAHFEILRQRGKMRARLWYWEQCLKAIPIGLAHSLYWSLVMLKNYLTVAFRSLYKNKLASIINILGLAIAASCAMVVFLFINMQFSMDRFHENADRIFLVEHTIENGGKSELWAMHQRRWRRR